MFKKDSTGKLAFSLDEAIADIVENFLVQPGYKVKILSIKEVDTAHKVIFEVKDGEIEEKESEAKESQDESAKRKNSRWVSVERFRDIYREVTIEGDNGKPVSFYVGLEIQSSPDKIMFTRVWVYNALAYYLQSLDYFNSPNKEGPILKPVFTVVINLSEKAWKGQTDLLESMDLKNLSALPNPIMSGLLLIDPFTPTYLKLFDTSLGMMLDLIPLINKPSQFYRFIKDNLEVYMKIHPLQKQLLDVYTDLIRYLDLEKGEEMPSFLDRFRDEQKQEGREEGLEIGREEGLEKGLEIGREEGREEERELNTRQQLNSIKILQQSGVTLSQLAKAFEPSVLELYQLQMEGSKN